MVTPFIKLDITKREQVCVCVSALYVYVEGQGLGQRINNDLIEERK